MADAPRVDAPPPAAANERPSELPTWGDRGPTELGRYRVLFPVARGGMGAVYTGALHGPDGFGSVVAIKVLRSNDRANEEVEAFFAEAKITARIHHKNVLSVTELGLHEGQPFLVMPFVRGVSLSKLRRRLSRDGASLPTELAAWIAAQVALGLHAAHELTVDGRPQGLVHRDVSPQNVLLGYDGRVVLLDFGIAKLFESAKSTESGIIKGKFGYMSPEQCAASPVDRRSDLFSLGIVLHEMLTGRDLFAQLPPAAALLRIASTIAEPPSRARPGIPARLDAIVARAMAPAREARYGTADELAQDLTELLASVGAPDGDRALRTLLADLFAEERDALERRLADAMTQSELTELTQRGRTQAQAQADTSDVAPATPTRDDTSKMDAPVELTVAPPPRRLSRRLAAPLLAAVLVGLGGGVAVSWRRGDVADGASPRSATTGPDSSRTDPGDDASAARAVSESPTPTALPSSASTGAANLAETASPSAARDPRGPRTPSGPPTAAASAPPVSAPSTAPSPTSAPTVTPSASGSAAFKGTPFRTF
jgi:eukaryotic-like serine/threonine-protein kinase